MEIMKLIPTGKDYLWGGTRLREEYGKKIDLTPLAETWECSVHPDGPSYVANGTYKGKTLAEVLKAHPEYLGTKVENGELPVLVKFIDAKKDLSVQVHPSDEYAREHEGDNGKTEMWYVINADEGASLIYGFQHEMTEGILRKAVETGTLDKHLQKVPVHKGDTYFVPAGTVHGIGKGILVAEIQENVESNYAYFPVVFDGYKYTRNEVFAMLEEQGITARKYFYPLTNSFECYRNYPTAGTEKTPVAQHLALRVLTLPLYADLALEDVDRICDIILG